MTTRNWMKMKYLGCITSSALLHKWNFLPLINNLKSNITKWLDLAINLIERIHLFKIMKLPKYLFIFHVTLNSSKSNFHTSQLFYCQPLKFLCTVCLSILLERHKQPGTNSLYVWTLLAKSIWFWTLCCKMSVNEAVFWQQKRHWQF